MNDGGYLAVSPLNSDIIFCVGNVYNSGYFFGVSHTSDCGTIWEHDTIPIASRGWAIAFDPTDSNRVYVGGDSATSYPALLITTDLGATWTMSRTGLSGSVNVLLTIPGFPNLVFAGTSNGVYKSTDAGMTWNATGFAHNTKALVADPTHGVEIYAGTYGNGTYLSPDHGTTWIPDTAGLTCTKVLSLAVRQGEPNTMFAGTEGGAVFKTTWSTGLAGPSPLAPSPPALSVSPNPCYSATVVRFSSSLPAHSTLALYDASGRLLSTSPFRTSPFELRTSELAPGAYFIRVNVGRTIHTARVTVLD